MITRRLASKLTAALSFEVAALTRPARAPSVVAKYHALRPPAVWRRGRRMITDRASGGWKRPAIYQPPPPGVKAMTSEYDPFLAPARPRFESSDLEIARGLFGDASRPYLSSPLPWLAWSVLLPAA